MHNLEKRVRKIEQKRGVDARHLVHWAAGQAFEDSLERSFQPDNDASRLLIHRQAMEGGHGSPVVPVPMSPDEAQECTKALAWANGK